jgi:hypothetical protein
MNILRKIYAHKKKLKLIQSFSFEKFYAIFMFSFLRKERNNIKARIRNNFSHTECDNNFINGRRDQRENKFLKEKFKEDD